VSITYENNHAIRLRADYKDTPPQCALDPL